MSLAEASWSLDARAPYLADHQPGGTPLLPTALCLEALAQACRARWPGATLAASDVTVGEPCLVGSIGQRTLDAIFQPVDQPDGPLHATLGSLGQDGTPRRHLQARFGPHVPRDDDLAPLAHRLATADSALVYRQFFHGPAYRVVSAAGWDGELLVARLARGLPPLRLPGGQPSVLAPRLLEFALQAAGLLEIARSQRSMIPHAIAHVERLRPLDEDSGVGLLAVARRAAGPEAIDVDVCTEDGRCALRVRGYRTVPLPFESDPRSLAALAMALRAGRRALAPLSPAPGVH